MVTTKRTEIQSMTFKSKEKKKKRIQNTSNLTGKNSKENGSDNMKFRQK